MGCGARGGLDVGQDAAAPVRDAFVPDLPDIGPVPGPDSGMPLGNGCALVVQRAAVEDDVPVTKAMVLGSGE